MSAPHHNPSGAWNCRLFTTENFCAVLNCRIAVIDSEQNEASEEAKQAVDRQTARRYEGSKSAIVTGLQVRGCGNKAVSIPSGVNTYETPIATKACTA